MQDKRINPLAKPSIPSTRLMEFVIPTIQKTVSKIENDPKSIASPIRSIWNPAKNKIIAIIICQKNFKYK